MALKIFISPLRYVQGPRALLQMGEQLRMLGIRNPLILTSPRARKAIEPTITQGLKVSEITFAFIDFNGECTWKEIERVRKACIDESHDAIISCGGGKTSRYRQVRCRTAGRQYREIASGAYSPPRCGCTLYQRPHCRGDRRVYGSRIPRTDGKRHHRSDPGFSHQSDHGFRRYRSYCQVARSTACRWHGRRIGYLFRDEHVAQNFYTHGWDLCLEHEDRPNLEQALL